MSHGRGSSPLGGAIAPGAFARPSERPASPTSDIRRAAIAWMDGSADGWSGRGIVEWSRDHLVATGFLHAEEGRKPIAQVWEPGVGVVTLDTGASGARALGRVLPVEEMPRIVRAARQRVLAALRGLLVVPVQDSFVQAALYAGRVRRVTGPAGAAHWTARFTCNVALGDQVLTLFAADLLRDREAYERDLSVCDRCGAVRFDRTAASRFGCADHPDGA